MKRIAKEILCAFFISGRELCTIIFCKRISGVFVFSLMFHVSFSQYSLGTIKEFTGTFRNVNSPAKQSHVLLRISGDKVVSVRIADNDCKGDFYYVFGSIEGHDPSKFFFKGDKGNVKGKIIFQKTKEAYTIYTSNAGEVFITPVDINKVICVDYEAYKEEPQEKTSPVAMEGNATAAPLLQSFPGAPGVIYLDFDGENVSGGRWGTINAQASSFSNAQITTIWTAISEDYSPFKINVTTDRTVFNSANPMRRIMVIFTPTTTAAPGAGGVAYMYAFSDGSGDPCWVFNNSVKSAEEAASHESGHTLGLSHDGTPSQGYYAGHSNWGPIMGAVYSRPIVQWSKGEYSNANEQEDDLAIISSSSNGVGYRTDDHGNTPAAATLLVANASGTVSTANNFGIIERNTDKDVFKFATTGGNVNFSLTAKTEPGSASVPDLDIQARLLDAGGTQIVKADPTGVLTTVVTISQNLAAGIYYLEIDGVGYGSPLNTGYSDYGSLGQYFISGTVPGGATTSINEAGNNHAITIFPNPSSGAFMINVPMEGNNESSIHVLNSLGQPVMISSENSSGSIHKEINLSGYAAGIYCVVVKSGNDVWKGKVIVK